MRRDWRWTAMDNTNREGRRGAAHDPFNAFLFRPGEPEPPDCEKTAADGALAGVSVAIKDNIAVRGMPMTCGSRLLEGYMPPRDACVVERLRAAGVVLAGKTNMDEFAMGSYGLSSAFGPVRNPRDPLRCAGGSSSGSAAAVAAGLVPLALGSDTGGSVRVPAAYCGVYGFKPSWGAISRRGLAAHASSMDTVGLLAKRPEELQSLFAVVSGRDAGDSSSFDPEACPRPLRGLRIGIWKEQMEAGSTAVQQAALDCAAQWEKRGAVVAEFSCAAMEMAGESYALLSSLEAASCLARYDGLRFGPGNKAPAALRAELLGKEVRRRILLGTTLLTLEEYDPLVRAARRRREAVRKELTKAFEGTDLLLGPTVPGPAPLVAWEADNTEERRADALTAVANLAGVPALAIPWGRQEGMPLSLQLTGPRGWDRTLLAAAEELGEGEWTA